MCVADSLVHISSGLIRCSTNMVVPIRRTVRSLWSETSGATRIVNVAPDGCLNTIPTSPGAMCCLFKLESDVKEAFLDCLACRISQTRIGLDIEPVASESCARRRNRFSAVCCYERLLLWYRNVRPQTVFVSDLFSAKLIPEWIGGLERPNTAHITSSHAVACQGLRGSMIKSV